ncbi:MAG: LacI family DNA-binding transcriptional regulator [Clostridium sp.]
MRYTIEDVAKRAGVSISTVSRVLNNNYPVKKETRERIEEAIKALDYKPNPLARGLVSGKSNIIGILVPNLKSLIYTEMISYLETNLSHNGYDVMITTTNSHKDEEVEAINRFLNRSVDGIIIIETELSRDDEFLKPISEKTPVMFVNAHNEKFNNVYVDNREAVESVLGYFLNIGHTKVAIISEEGNKVHDECIKHYKDYAREQELYPVVFKVKQEELDNEHIDILEEQLESRGYLLGRDITSFIVCDDLVMMRTINALANRKVNIPGDISIINLKNTTLSKIVNPSISTIDISPNKIADSVAEKMLSLLKNKEYIIEGEKVYTGIIERDSCKSLRRQVNSKLEDYFL